MAFQIGETFKISATIVDENDTAANPVSVLISVRNPDRTLSVDSAVMVNTAVGAYYYWNTVSNQTGKHFVKIVANGTFGDVIETFEYTVVESFGI